MADPAPDPGDDGDMDLSIAVTPAQAMELRRLAENLKNAYALLAMKRIQAAMGDEGAEGEGLDVSVNRGMDLADEEGKISACLAAYSLYLEECGYKPNSEAFEQAMSHVAHQLHGSMLASPPTSVAPAPIVEPPPPEPAAPRRKAFLFETQAELTPAPVLPTPSVSPSPPTPARDDAPSPATVEKSVERGVAESVSQTLPPVQPRGRRKVRGPAQMQAQAQAQGAQVRLSSVG
ncbi:hypothetical protein BDK51DRAFT_47465 [Blyttiomyces helicus]|uniref:Uncharacterized protein n=1 Tax=Blyttiomyces helicus TaxID=388810 RepID=A0A4P9W1C0_9FUNG|nr:hypothetical protein BDK51DRAFT_47465 [Blyttiomyces helicus]|eukprot:RKO85904.1 hypothetical protein BDK51DRAFT_47465 [Blyttiomyces helicus]